MPNQRACIPCNSAAVNQFIRDRMAMGAPLNVISAELAHKNRHIEFGYTKSPGFTMVQTHVQHHMSLPKSVRSSTMPSFSSPAPVPVMVAPSGDVAGSIQRAALEMLERGELRLTASHALRAQEILDRRAEKQQDRELKVVLARLLTRDSMPPPKYVGGDEDIIEGVAVEVTA